MEIISLMQSLANLQFTLNMTALYQGINAVFAYQVSSIFGLNLQIEQRRILHKKPIRKIGL